MPAESLFWERKDFLKERKHERSDSFGHVARWRDSPHHARDFNRWGSGKIRRLSGHSRQRSWHMFSEESNHGNCQSWTSCCKLAEEERAMIPVLRGDGKNGRNGRESRSSSQRDWRDRSWEASNGHRHSVGRSRYDMTSDHKSNNGQKSDRETSLNTSDWKPVKWSRTASLSSRGSGFNNSGCLKSLEILDTEEKSKSLFKNGSSIQPPPTDLVVFPLSSLPSEDTNSRKKPRLGWGEGLAKYEKKKIEDIDAGASKDAVSSRSVGETSHSCGIRLAEKYEAAGFSDCLSPATSVACSSSPVVDDKSFEETSGADGNLCSMPSTGRGSRVELKQFSFIVERIKKLDTFSFATLGSLLTEILQSNDLSCGASDDVKSAAISKLLLCKSEISKELEATQSEIDSLENELKLLICGTGDRRSSIPLSATPLPLQTTEKYSEHQQVVCSSIVQSDPLELVQDIAIEDDNSHAIAPSELVRPLSQVRELSSPSAVNPGDDVGEDRSRNSIVVANHEQARRASEVFDRLLEGCEHKKLSNSFSSLNVNRLVREKVARRKKFLKFQERVLGLKYNALWRSWKGTQLASMRKSRTKPHKLRTRASNSAHQKHRSFTSSQFSAPGNVSSEHKAGIVDCAGKLPSGSQRKACRDTLKMPDLILDKKERMASRFISSNGLIEDPCVLEKERSLINPWTPEERIIFVDKLRLFGKDFSRIASFLDHKTTADCVEFYYKNHKSDDFQKIKKKVGNSKNEDSVSTMYMVTKGNKHSCKFDSAYLDMLGTASEMVIAYENDKSRLLENFGLKDDLGSNKQTLNLDFTGNEKEAIAADVLAGIGGSLSSEAMSSCVTSSIDPADGCNKKWKRKNGSCVVKKHLPHGTILQADEETCSDESCGELEPFDWTDEEKSIFVQAVSTDGKDFVMVSKWVGTKSRDQCSVFFSKARKCLGLELIPAADSRSVGTSVSGESDVEDGCILESGSFTSGTKFCSKMDEDSRQSAASAGDGDSNLPEASLINQWRSGENCELSTFNRCNGRLSTIDDEKDGVVETKGGGSGAAMICSKTLGNVFGEEKNADTGTTHQNELPPRDSDNLLGDPSKDHPCIISLPGEKSSGKNGHGSNESNLHSIKRVASFTVPNGNSLKWTSKKMDGDDCLKRCIKPQRTGDEEMCKSSKKGGNIKLFGKILDHLGSVQNENEETANLSCKSELD